MKRKSVDDRIREKSKYRASIDSQGKKVAKTQSEIEKELNIRSYSEYKIKDDDSLLKEEDEDIETKMIRLVIVKKKGGNILEHMNIKKKNKKKEGHLKLPKIRQAFSILEIIYTKRKQKKFLHHLKINRISLNLKKNIPFFFQSIQKYILRVYIKKIYHTLIQYFSNNINYKEILNKNRSKGLLFSPNITKKQSKKFKLHNSSNMKAELITKKGSMKKKSGLDTLLVKIEKEKELERLKQQTNIHTSKTINKKLKKLSSLNRKEKKHYLKAKESKKMLQNEVTIFKKRTNINEVGLSQIKQKFSLSDKDSSFFSEETPSGLKSANSNNTGSKSNNTSSNSFSFRNNDSKNNNNVDISKKEDNKEINDDDLYSFKSKESNKTKKDLDPDWKRKTVKSFRNKKLRRATSKKNMRVSAKLSNLSLKKIENGHTSMFSLKNQEETNRKNGEIVSVEEELEKSGEEENEDKEEEEEESSTNYNFIRLPSEQNEDEEDIYRKKVNLVEYDLFYKEQYLRNDVFKYDVENIKDREVEKINKEMNKLDIKRKLIEKKKLKDVLELKGADTKLLQEEINDLNEKYKDIKKVEKQKIELNIDTTEEFYNKGKLLNIYFENKKEKNVPRFALESSEEIGAKEIIDFKPLRREEASRRYFDYCFCLEQRKKINKFLLYARYISKFFVDNWIFDNLSLLMIMINSILMFISDPTDQDNIANKTDNYFLIFYTIEALLKIVTYTFYSAEDAYLKDYWNILDLFVVVIGILSFILEKSMGGKKLSGLSALKAFRILRPLKTVKRFKGLKKLVLALLASIGHLGETVTILFFFFLFFAIAGLQMWQGLFYRRCMNLNYGYFTSFETNEYMCSFDSNCESLNSYGQIFICAKGYNNPDYGAINFDNIGTSLITVFIIVTLEGWSYIFTYVSKTFKDKIYINPIIVIIYFHALIYFGAFYLINLFLAVTNSEFEHIERNREQLNEKKSFFKLIQSEYDIREKKKQEKKKIDKKLKNKNNKKSDETLKELYYKVKDEAFHISKNKRDIPKVYSTVKDIYIMANNNPEELYLEKLRIENEEKSLCQDIKRQQKEIDLLIEEKKKEMGKLKITSKKSNKIKYNKRKGKKEQMEDTKLTDNNKISKINNLTTNNYGSIIFDETKNNKLNKLNSNLNLNQINSSVELSEIIQVKNNINHTLIDISIDNTIKYFNDKIINMAKTFTKYKEEKSKVKEINDKSQENDKMNQISFFEDTSFEKELNELNRIKREKITNEFHNKRKLTKMKILNDQSISFLSRKNKEKSTRKLDFLYLKNSTFQDLSQRNMLLINKELSFIDDLSLSSLSNSSQTKSNASKKKINRGNTNFRPKNNLLLTKLIFDDFKNNIDNLSYDNDMFSKNVFGFNKYRIKKAKNNIEINNDVSKDIDKDINKDKSKDINKYINKNINQNINNSFNDSRSIINSKGFELCKEITLKSNFKRPYSILNRIIKYEDDQKFNDENIRFNLKKYLKKEVEKDNEFLNKDKRKSFLGFLEYAQFQKELKELDEMIKNESDDENDLNDNTFSEDNLHFLSEESYLSRNDNISLEDIEMLPNNVKENKIYDNEYLIHENIRKNLDSNKLTQKIRSEVFDRKSINTNINLTTNELKKFYEEANKKLDEQLYVNRKKIRLRKDMNINVSAIINEKNYNKNLKVTENTEQDLNNESEGNKNEIKNSHRYLNSSKASMRNSKKNVNNELDEIDNENKKEKRVSENKNTIDNLINETEKNSGIPLINKQKSMKMLNLRLSSNSRNMINRGFEKRQTLKFNLGNKTLNRSSYPSLYNNTNGNNDDNQNDQIMKSATININKKNNNIFIFKAKSIDKNKNKYPVEDSNKYLVKEENKRYTDPLTVKQELIPSNLRGTKYYMNYLYNIHDKDLKVKDNFKIDHWEDEILGNNNKIIKLKPLPKRKDAFFVFNDEKLKLKKYKYLNYDDDKFNENELTYLTIKLKYLPLSVLSLIPKRLRDFGKYTFKKDTNQCALSFRPDSALLSTRIIGNPKSFYNSRNTRTTKIKNKGTIITNSDFTDNFVLQDEIRFKKNTFERMYKKIDEFNYLTLSHYFLQEEELYYKFFDAKKKEENINKIRESNRKKYNRLNVKKEVENIILFDIKTNSSRYIKWSGEDILYHSDIDKYKKKWNKIINSLEDFNMIIWNQNAYIKAIQKLRYAFYVFANTDYFDYCILGIVLINSIFLALDGNFLMPETLNKLNICNYAFNGIYIFEYIVKFIGLTPLVFYADAFTYLDTIIICFAIVDMATPGNNDVDVVGSKKSVSSQLSFLRVFRIFRVVRLAKLLRRLKPMRLIIVSIKKALTSVYYIIIILIMFILIFVLLGISLLNGSSYYQSFYEGIYTTYQILTVENWDGIFIEFWSINNLSFFYFIIWIFLGNYFLLNLFTSILLQSFGENDKDDEDDLTEDEQIEKIYILPDYLFTLKNKIKDNNLGKIHSQRKKVDKEVVNNILNNSNTFSTSKDVVTKYSSSFINLNNSKLSIINDDEEKEEKDESVEKTIDDDIIDDFNNISNYNGIEKTIRKWKKINKLFKNNECENSLFFIPQSNCFRIFSMKIINKKWFDIFILLIIILSSIRLVVDTFINGYTFVLLFDICDLIFNLIFLIEACLKIVALGFAFDEGSYLRDNWNKIDAIIVVCSFVEFHNLFQKYIMSRSSSSSVEFLKVLRLLRTLRPLRFISHNMQLKLIITSLFDSSSSIFNALLVLVVVLYMFSIVGMSLFYSYYHDCYILTRDKTFKLATDSFNNLLVSYEIKNDITSISKFCADKFNGIMDTGPTFKFSNLKTSLITSYILSTMEGWGDIMNSYRIFNEFYGIYFIAFNLVVSYFFLNLFTGIMFKYFNEAYRREQKISKDDKKAPKYYDFLTQIVDAQSNYILWNKPMKGTIKYYLREIVDSNFFEDTIMIIIFLNMIVMALSYDGCSEKLTNILKIINYIFTFVFIIECLLKLFAYGLKAYFYVSWNKFDFFIIVVSIIDWIVAGIDGIDAAFLKTFQIIRVLKVLRVSRVIRLVKALKGLEKLIQTLQWSFSALVNVLSLIFIIYCIFALIGCYLYDGEKYEQYKGKFTYINEYYNMDNFYYSYLLIFRCATGENWPNIMMEMAYREDGRDQGYSIAFFILNNFIIAIILLNLLLMVILQQYDEFSDKKYNPIEKFNSFLTDFNNCWNKFSTEEDEGFRINKFLITQFFMELNWRKLNFPEKGKLEYIKKYLTDLKLNIDNEDFVYYHDVIFKIIYKQMGSQIDRNNPENNLIFKTEKKIQIKIKKIINDYISKNKTQNSQKQKNVLITFNPLTAHLYYKLSFLYLKTFINYYKENSELLQHLGETNTFRIDGTDSVESNESSEKSSQNDESKSNSQSSYSSSVSGSKSNSNSNSNSESNNNNKVMKTVIKSSISEEENSNSNSKSNSEKKSKSNKSKNSKNSKNKNNNEVINQSIPNKDNDKEDKKIENNKEEINLLNTNNNQNTTNHENII